MKTTLRWLGLTMVTTLLLALGLPTPVRAADGPATLLKDINPTGAADPRDFATVGGTLFFTADDGVHGRELWKSDGTTAGTRLVKDITPGAAATFFISDPATFLSNVNDTLFFTTGTALWKSDGTEVGTVIVKDFSSFGTSDLTNVNGTLFFVASQNSDGSFNDGLWKSDGTENGTVPVKNMEAPPGGLFISYWLTNVNGTLFFIRVFKANYNYELWKSDGTAAGTVQVKDINPGDDGSYPHMLTNMNGVLFFVADDGTSGAELWRSDGTAVGTVRVKDINPGNDGSGPDMLTNVNGTLFFAADDGSSGRELWRSDGTDAGTVRVKDINPGVDQFFSLSLTNVNGTLFFVANDGTSGYELWKSDGTAAGTVQVKDINPYQNALLSPSDLTDVNGTLFFSADDGTSGHELWASDGTATGTVLVQDIAPGKKDGFPYGFTELGANLLFTADDGTHGRELWVAPLDALRAPFATSTTLFTRLNAPLSGVLSARVPSGAPLTYRIVAPPAHGTVTLTNAATGAFTYTPQADFQGADTFTYAASDGVRDSNVATLTVQVSNNTLALPLVAR